MDGGRGEDSRRVGARRVGENEWNSADAVDWGLGAWEGAMSATLTVHSASCCCILSPFYPGPLVQRYTCTCTYNHWGPAAGNPTVGLAQRKNGQKN
jgi:hypothetical protein